MNLKRIARDVLILVLFCGGFFLMIHTVDLFGGEKDALPAESEFSESRIRGDLQYTKGQYLLAVKHYEKLIEQDPDNGHAWYHLGMCYENYRKIFRKMVWQHPSSDPRTASWSQTAAKNGDLAIEPFLKCMDFPRYRNMARMNLAEIYAVKGDDENALKYIREMLDDGSYTREGLAQNPDLVSLRGNSEFQALVEQDKRNRRLRFRRSRTNSGLQSSTGN